MIKLINGVVYDVDKSRSVFRKPSEDTGYSELFCGRSQGIYFLVHKEVEEEEGSMFDIEPLLITEAMLWLFENKTLEAVEKEFAKALVWA